MVFFCEAPTKNLLKKMEQNNPNILYHVLWMIHTLFACKKFCSHSLSNTHFFADLKWGKFELYILHSFVMLFQ
jgi:hypothetical protein